MWMSKAVNSCQLFETSASAPLLGCHRNASVSAAFVASTATLWFLQPEGGPSLFCTNTECTALYCTEGRHVPPSLFGGQDQARQQQSACGTRSPGLPAVARGLVTLSLVT